ncbi:MAG: hypothetical protein PHS56_05325 [Eubacteriales bacterium]|nr:hypothetical protein [Eubacteriales bacterium]MDD4078597.1 hypothetical protein [Eubacteriales bacterium]MDD4768856.1 hypothetical protein [Eubacteriales bacterium]
MRIWKLHADVNHFDTIATVDEDDWDLDFCNGESLKNTWVPLHFEYLDNRRRGDSPGFSEPVLSERALTVLSPLISTFSEILPIFVEKEKFYLLNVTTVLDCIDYDNSCFETFPDSNRIMWFQSYSFLPEVVRGMHIFKISDENKRNPFVSDEFRDAVIANKLTGFHFEEVWNEKPKEEY